MLIMNERNVQTQLSLCHEMSEMCPKGMLKAWSPAAVFRGEALGKWQDPEGSDPIGGLTHGWTNNLMHYWEVVETAGGGGAGWGVPWRDYLALPSPSLLPFPGCQGVSCFPPPHPSALPQAQSNGASSQWTKSSGTMGQNQSSLLKVVFLRHFVLAMES